MNFKKIIYSIVLPIVLVGAISFYIFKTQLDDNFTEKINVLNKVEWWWLLLGVLMTLTYYFIESLIFKHNVTILKNKPGYSLKDSFIVTMVGIFYMTVTPFSSGGHLFQVYFMQKQGFKTQESLLVLMMNFIMYTWAMILISVGFFIFMHDQISSNFGPFKYLFWSGIVLNVCQNIVLLFVTSSKLLHLWVTKFYTWILTKINKKKPEDKKIDIDDKLHKMNVMLKRYRYANNYILENKMYFIKQISLNLLRFSLYATIPIFIALSLNMDFGTGNEVVVKCLQLMGTTIFMQVLQTVVPTPGGSGAAEIMCSIMWAYIFKDPVSAPVAMIIWRLLTYYLHIVIAMPYTFYYQIKYAKNEISGVENV